MQLSALLEQDTLQKEW